MHVHAPLNVHSQKYVRLCVRVCVCVCWPCPVSPPLLDKESHLSPRIVLAFHLRLSLKSRIITQPSDRAQRV